LTGLKRGRQKPRPKHLKGPNESEFKRRNVTVVKEAHLVEDSADFRANDPSKPSKEEIVTAEFDSTPTQVSSGGGGKKKKRGEMRYLGTRKAVGGGLHRSTNRAWKVPGHGGANRHVGESN